MILRRKRNYGPLEVLDGTWKDWKDETLPQQYRDWLYSNDDHGIVNTGQKFNELEVRL